jgi:LysM repeat protein
LDWLAGLTGAFIGGSIVFGIITGGVSAEIEFEMAANELAEAAGLMTEMELQIANAILLLENAMTIATPVVTQFILGAAADGTALVVEKLQHGQNPLSWDSWTPDDFSNMALGGLVVGIWGRLWNGVGALSAFQDARPILSSAVWNASAAFTWAVPWEFWIKNQPFDLKTWETVFESSLVSFVSVPFWKGMGNVIPILGRILNNAGPSPIFGVTWSDISNNAVSVPISGEKLFFITGGPPFQIPSSSVPPELSSGVPVPELPPPSPVPPIPPHIGGGVETVKSGDNLYDISARTLGNPNLYPVLEAANPLTVGPNGEIIPGQKLLIPVLPEVPHGSTAQVVQPGQSLSDFADGNPQLEQQIAELNGLKNPNLIFPGQVLIVPPAS